MAGEARSGGSLDTAKHWKIINLRGNATEFATGAAPQRRACDWYRRWRHRRWRSLADLREGEAGGNYRPIDLPASSSRCRLMELGFPTGYERYLRRRLRAGG
jgi:hypothetical protein